MEREEYKSNCNGFKIKWEERVFLLVGFFFLSQVSCNKELILVVFLIGISRKISRLKCIRFLGTDGRDSHVRITDSLSRPALMLSSGSAPG